ncbi:MAG: TPM domain-containing protein [Arenimonas sp.]
MIRGGFLAALLLLAPALGQAAVEVPVLKQHVTDLTGTLSAAQLAELEAPLVALEQRKGSQLTVLVIPSTGDQAIEEYSLAVAEKNRIGRSKVDDGLLLLVAKDDRKARIEVGYGLEGVVTDALSSRVIREYLAPNFRKGDYFGGIRDASGVLAKLVEGESLPAPMAVESHAGPPPFIYAFLVGLLVGSFASVTGIKPAFLRRLGAGGIAAVIGWLIFSAGFAALVAAVAALLFSGAGGMGGFTGGGNSWGGRGGGGGVWGGGGGGGWSGGGGSFGGGGASGGW